MAISDEYELTPEYFQRVVPKCHPNLRYMMKFHKEIIEEGTRLSNNATEF